MIRILHVVTHLNRGGLETMIMNYYRNIDKKIIQFDFLVQGEEIGDYENEIVHMGGKIYRVGRIKPYAPWVFEKEVYTFLKNHKEYKIVHSHINTFSKYVLRAAKRAKVPNRIANSHTILKNVSLKNIYKNIVKIGINKYCTKRFACSKESGEWLYGKKNFEVLPNAIDIEKFKFNESKRKEYREKMNLKDDETVYFNIGRFEKPKNQIFLIEIFYEIQKKQNAKLVLIGDGSLRNSLQNKVKKLGIEKKVIFTGVRSDVNDLINAMDVFVFPSLYEGLGIVLVEAQSNGIPCYASNKVPKEVNLSGTVNFISLSFSSKQWAYDILSKTNIRINNQSTNVFSDYDIHNAAKKLQRTYLKMYQEVE